MRRMHWRRGSTRMNWDQAFIFFVALMILLAIVLRVLNAFGVVG